MPEEILPKLASRLSAGMVFAHREITHEEQQVEKATWHMAIPSNGVAATCCVRACSARMFSPEPYRGSNQTGCYGSQR